MSNYKFLVIDDDRTCLDVMSIMLNSLGYEVEACQDPEVAVRLLADPEQSKLYTGVFLDIFMPNINGYEVLKSIRECEYTKTMPVIMLTALGSYSEIMDGYKYGADYYIVKPVTTKQISFALDLLLSPDRGTDDETDEILLPEA